MKTIFTFGLYVLLAKVIFAQTPEAKNVQILGSGFYNNTLGIGTTLTGQYYFDDLNQDSDASTYQWYRDGAAISPDGDGIRYILTAADLNTDITFKVTPINGSGDIGNEETSAAKPISDQSYNDLYIGNNVTHTTPNSGTEHYMNVTAHQSADSIFVDWDGTLNIYGDLDLSNVNSFALRAYGPIIIHGKLIVKNNVRIYIHFDTYIEVKSGLYAKEGANINIDGDLNVGGDVTLVNNAVIDVHFDSMLDVGGNLDIGDGAKLQANGDISVDGNFDTGSGSTIDTHWDSEVIVGGDLTGESSIGGHGDVTVGGTVLPPASITSDGTHTILPIELTYFKALHTESAVIINWQTASEENNDYFTIERSINGINFQTIATVMGAGFSSTPLNYSYTDNNPVNGVSYYRLSQTDYDGENEKFNPVAVSYLNEGDISIGPNPTTNFVSVSIGAEMGISKIKIYNLTGAVVKSINMQSSYSQINISELPAGTYMMVINAGEINISRRIIKE